MGAKIKLLEQKNIALYKALNRKLDINKKLKELLKKKTMMQRYVHPSNLEKYYGRITLNGQ